jgi:putative membrane protein insertion efficiency factor
MIRRILLTLLRHYRYWVSPVVHALSPTGCKFHPTCSQYASEAVAIHGALRGVGMAIARLLRCHPFSRGGFDPVPLPGEVGGALESLNWNEDWIDAKEHGRLAAAALRKPLP